MGDITRVITLGIGPAATIDGLILVGLNIRDVQSWPYGPVVVIARGERVYPSNIIPGVEAIANTRQVRAVDTGYNSANVYIPTPGATLYMHTPGVTLTIGEIRGYFITEINNGGAWAFEDGTLIGGG